MLCSDMYSKEYLDVLYEKSGNDPSLLERVIYAFGLLEVLKKSGLPFCFKGGTSLMLLLKQPRRLSTDIDIIVNPNINIDKYIKETGGIFPFVDVMEQIRTGRNNIQKRHFRFKYCSPRTGNTITILLDVLFEDIKYIATVNYPIKNDFLITEGDDLLVTMPNINCILGDKLTAFAPHTTGIPFNINKEMEIIKQLFDCGSLIDEMDDYNQCLKTYNEVVKCEMGYRGLNISKSDVLKDTIEGCLCIASRGQLKHEDYFYYKDGISRIRSHIIGRKFNGEIAGAYAGKILYLVSNIFLDNQKIEKIEDLDKFVNAGIEFEKPRSFSYLQVVDPIAYACVVKTSTMLKNTELINIR